MKKNKNYTFMKDGKDFFNMITKCNLYELVGLTFLNKQFCDSNGYSYGSKQRIYKIGNIVLKSEIKYWTKPEVFITTVTNLDVLTLDVDKLSNKEHVLRVFPKEKYVLGWSNDAGLTYDHDEWEHKGKWIQILDNLVNTNYNRVKQAVQDIDNKRLEKERLEEISENEKQKKYLKMYEDLL